MELFLQLIISTTRRPATEYLKIAQDIGRIKHKFKTNQPEQHPITPPNFDWGRMIISQPQANLRDISRAHRTCDLRPPTPKNGVFNIKEVQLAPRADT